jgi:hypothetical protein
MVSSSYNTTRITTIRSRSNFAHIKEQKHECNNPFFDRKIENATEGLKLECYKQFYKISHYMAVNDPSAILQARTSLSDNEFQSSRNALTWSIWLVGLNSLLISHENKISNQF